MPEVVEADHEYMAGPGPGWRENTKYPVRRCQRSDISSCLDFHPRDVPQQASFAPGSVGQGLDHHLEPWSSQPPSPHLDGEGRGDQGPGGK